MRTQPFFLHSSLLLVGLAASGCNLVLDLGGFTDQAGDGGGGSGTGGTPPQGGGGSNQGAGGIADGGGGNGAGITDGGGGSGPTCESATHACVEAPPVEWTGPVALYTGPAADAPPACAGAYPDAAGELNGGLVPGDAVCDCNCGAAQGIQCTSSATVCYTSNCNNIICNTTDAVLPPGQCTNIPGTAATSAKTSNPAPTNMGSCASASDHSIPTPAWETAAVACDGADTTPVGCDGGELCAPKAFAPIDQLCIVHAGNVPCPVGSAYTEQHVLFDDFEDTRACSSCGCGAATSTCAGGIDFVSNSCMILQAEVNAGGCGVKGASNAAIYTPNPSGTCQPTGGDLSGTAEATGPVTYCCLP